MKSLKFTIILALFSVTGASWSPAAVLVRPTVCELNATTSDASYFHVVNVALWKTINLLPAASSYYSPLVVTLTLVDAGMRAGEIGMGAPSPEIAAMLPKFISSVRPPAGSGLPPFVWIPPGSSEAFAGPDAEFQFGELIRVLADVLEFSKGKATDPLSSYRLRAMFWMLLVQAGDSKIVENPEINAALTALTGSDEAWSKYVDAETSKKNHKIKSSLGGGSSASGLKQMPMGQMVDEFRAKYKMSALQRYVQAVEAAAQPFAPPGTTAELLVTYFIRGFPVAFQHYIRGNQTLGDQELRKFFANYPEIDDRLQSLIRDVALKVASDPGVARAYVNLATSPNVTRLFEDNERSIEEAFFVMTTALESGASNMTTGLNAMYVRPQQLEMFMLAYQYTKFNKEQGVLEIGYGSPAVLASLSPLGAGSLVGMDVFEPSDALKQQAKERLNISLVQGTGPRDQQKFRSLLRPGSFGLIYGLDVFKRRVAFGAQFNPGVSNTDYLRWIFSLLAEGGVFVIANDASTPTVFTETEIRDAGLRVVQLNRPREMDTLVTGMHENGGGRLSVTVLRKGEETSRFLRPN